MEYTARCTECNHEIVGYDLDAMKEVIFEYECEDCCCNLCEFCVKWNIRLGKEVPICNNCAVIYMLEDLGIDPKVEPKIVIDKDGNITAGELN